jgi:two-component system phosphate regulon sensor histidine kinase PhoR
MEKRIKIIHWLTAVALIALVIIQGYWLFNQYVYALQQYEEELFRKTLDTGLSDRELRKELQNEDLFTFTNTSIRVRQNIDTVSNTELEWVFNAYIIDKKQVATAGLDSLSPQQMDSLYESGKGVKKYRFNIKGSNRGEYDVYDALERFYINELCPFTTERFDSLLQAQGIKP